jgi:hypothetical protein
MKFLAGFLSASLLWGGLGALVMAGVIPLPGAPDAGAVDAGVDAEDEAGSPNGRRQAGRRRGRLKDSARRGHRTDSSADDDIGWDEAREVDMAQGEQQLSGAEIERGFDSVMPRIRRCLVLVPGEGEIAGRLTFAMKVGSDGKVRAVNLGGPAVVTGGEAGSCLRDAARSIQFTPYDGPETLFKFPVDLQ